MAVCTSDFGELKQEGGVVPGPLLQRSEVKVKLQLVDKSTGLIGRDDS